MAHASQFLPTPKPRFKPIPKYAPHEFGAVRERRPGKGLAQGRVGAAAVGETRGQGGAGHGVGEPFDGVGAAVHAFDAAPHGGVAAVACCGWGGGGCVGVGVYLNERGDWIRGKGRGRLP